jgi:hypothetical protein
MKNRKYTTHELEVEIAKYFNYFKNLIIPCVYFPSQSYGHECDLLVITKAGYAIEIEIKISLCDLKADMQKIHNHNSKKLRYLYFAIPQNLEIHIEYIPSKAGILVLYDTIVGRRNGRSTCIKEMRKPQTLSNYKLTSEEQYRLARLGALRIWTSGARHKLNKVYQNSERLFN